MIAKIVSWIEYMTELVGKLASWLLLGLILLMVGDVIFRKVFRITSVAIVELEWHLFAVIFLLGLSYALQHNKHVRVDVFYDYFSPVVKAWVNLMGTLLFLMPFCVVVIMNGWQFAGNSWAIGESSADPGGLPSRYIIKSVIVVGFTLLFLQGLRVCCLSWKVISETEDA